MSTQKLTVIEVKQNNKSIYIGKIPVEELKKYTTVDRYQPKLPIDDSKQGYQRSAESRYKQFANYLLKEEHPFCPTALLLSARNSDLKFDPIESTIELDSRERLQIVDGQHREKGYSFAIYEKNAEELIGFETPVIIMHDIDRVTEMRQFAVVNGKQRKVRLDLVNMILSQIVDQQGADSVDKKELSRVIVSRAVEELNNNEKSPWHDKIIMPNEKAFTKKQISENPELRSRKVVLATSFMTSLKPIYTYLGESHTFLEGDAREQGVGLAAILIEYWGAIKELIPSAFEDPSEYVIQKTPGLFSLHSICKRLLPIMHTARRPWRRSEFVNLLERSNSLGSTEFWNVDDGEAAKYGSMKGFADLATIIHEELIEV
jgi:DGQHR domain-containing protein